MLTVRTIGDPGYSVELPVAARPDELFDALTTLDGLASWWTSVVSGSPAEVGGEVTFGFADQHVVMRVERADAARVVWTCLRHTRFPQWRHTRLSFGFEPLDDRTTLLAFWHVGLVPGLGECHQVCSRGWDHYLASLAGHVTGEGGSPWGSEGFRRAVAARR
jgi:uncharacterized protein YndB with AHSA1/START domain